MDKATAEDTTNENLGELNPISSLMQPKPLRYQKWGRVHLTKVERKGKTYEELQELRKGKMK